MNIRDIRVQLETVLTDVLGTYRLANGATTPAIAVRAAGESLPPGTTVEGLEVVIVRDPEPVPVVQYRQETAGDRWTLYLVDWSGDTPLQTVAGRLIWAYPGSNAVLINVPRGVGPGAQMRVDLQTRPNAATFDVDTNYPQESVKYQVLVDADTAGSIYVGKAPQGVAESAARWTVTRSIYDAAGIRTSKGTAAGVTWTGRASHTYS
jgi:hypothetical protein